MELEENEELILEYEKEVMRYMMNEYPKRKKNTTINSPELKRAVDYIETRAKFYSNTVTEQLLNLQESNISFFIELDQRLKQRERIIEKVKQKMEVDHMSIIEAANLIGDTLRYTIIIDEKLYTEKVDEYLRSIEELGYKVYKFKNKWGDEYYQGLNVIFEDDMGFKFEVQFHTLGSYTIKEGKLRNVYNIIRDKNSPEDLRKKSNIIRRYYQKQVDIPIGAVGYEYHSNEKKRG